LKRDESPLSAARRETREELGVDIDNWQAIGDVLSRFQHTKSTMYCFRADLRDPQLTLDRGELLTARWFALDELPPNLAGHVGPILVHAGF
jgi:8-oxo-dGTP pyrophosphatase MutT (NUDIX family)